jgi:PIN domain nuclease of toxin-antitoxin system
VKYLVDTNAWIGFLEGERGFGPRAKDILQHEPWECRVSLASVWEAAIKVGLGKLKLGYSLDTDLPRLFEENGFEVIAPDWRAVTAVQQLEPTHGDPFDRIQVVQARQRGMDIISRDPVFDRYGLRRVW